MLPRWLFPRTNTYLDIQVPVCALSMTLGVLCLHYIGVSWNMGSLLPITTVNTCYWPACELGLLTPCSNTKLFFSTNVYNRYQEFLLVFMPSHPLWSQMSHFKSDAQISEINKTNVGGKKVRNRIDTFSCCED